MGIPDEAIVKILDLLSPGTPGTGAAAAFAVRKIADAIANTRTSPAPPPARGNGAPALPGLVPVPPVIELTPTEIFARLEDLTLPDHILHRAEPIFAKANYTITKQMAKAGFGSEMRRPFTQATRNGDGIKLALVNVPCEVYRKSDLWGSLMQAVDEIDAFVRFVSENHKETYPEFTGFLDTVGKRGKKWDFTPWNWMEAFLSGRQTVEMVFRLPKAGAMALSLEDFQGGGADRKTIAEILLALAAEGGALTPRQILRNLAEKAGWPPKMITKMAGGPDDAEEVVRQVLNLATNWGSFEVQAERYGDTYLGALLEALLDEFGDPKRSTVAGIIVKYSLVKRPDALAKVKKCFAA